MLDALWLKNFRAHGDTRLALGRLTVLVGPNGTGKTTALDAVHLLSQVHNAQWPAQVLVGPRAPAALAGDPSAGHWEVGGEGRVSDEPFHVVARWRVDSQGASTVDDERRLGDVVIRGTHGLRSDATRLTGGPVSSEALLRAEATLQRATKSAALYRLDARVCAAPASSVHAVPRVEFDGRNLAATLKALRLGYDAEWSRIEALVRAVVPNVRSLYVEIVPAPAYDVAPSASSILVEASGEYAQLGFVLTNGARVPAPLMSEGTLLTVAIATILLGPTRPRIALFDDLEQGLHPLAQLELATQLRRLSDELGDDLQVIATTHSPYLLDAVGMDDVRVFALGPDGRTRIKPLSAHPDAARLRGVTPASDLWTSCAEGSWVVDGAGA